MVSVYKGAVELKGTLFENNPEDIKNTLRRCFKLNRLYNSCILNSVDDDSVYLETILNPNRKYLSLKDLEPNVFFGSTHDLKVISRALESMNASKYVLEIEEASVTLKGNHLVSEYKTLNEACKDLVDRLFLDMILC